jgi:hypothetical protein
LQAAQRAAWEHTNTIIPSATNSQSWNRYSYSYNNPLNYTDPSGHAPILDDCNFNGKCTDTGTFGIGPTKVIADDLDNFVSKDDEGITKKVGGKQVYDLYLKYWHNHSGRHWAIFGQDGDFSIWDFLSFMLYWESAQKPDNAKLLAEATIRFFYGGYGANPSISDSIENILNWWGLFSESTARRTASWPDNSEFNPSLTNDQIGQMSIFGDRFQNPGSWRTGYNRFRPYGFGNYSVYSPMIDDNVDALFLITPDYTDYDRTFIIPSGCAYSRADHHWETVVCPPVINKP